MWEFGEDFLHSVKIKVFGIGGGGCNAVNTMITSKLEGVEFISANTDAQDLKASLSPIKIQLGQRITRGNGTGANPEIGKNAAREDMDKIKDAIIGTDMIFITTGLGGGTGTGGAPVVAEVAKELEVLTVAVATKPFLFEGKTRMKVAEEGLNELKKMADTVITVPNQRLLSIASKNSKLVDAFKLVDEVLLQAVRGISSLITSTGLINLDFADIATIMSEKGTALMGTGTAIGEHRAIEAAQKAISSPFLENATIGGAKGILINVTGGPDMTLYEVNEAAMLIQEEVDDEANIIFGAVIDETYDDQIIVTVIATGIGQQTEKKKLEVPSFMNDFIRDDMEIPPYVRKKKEQNNPLPIRGRGKLFN